MTLRERARIEAPAQGANLHEGLDLFGQVVVTWPEVFDWVEAVAGIPRDSPRAWRYVHGWRVPDKVARAKLDGTYHATVSRPPPEPHWWARFRWY